MYINVYSWVNSGFGIEELLEPYPTEEFKKVAPQDYEKLMVRPQFLFIRARKFTM